MGTRHYKVNDDFFDLWTDEMAYVLGFLCGDGCVRKNSDRVEFLSTDGQELEKIKKTMSCEGPVLKFKRKPPRKPLYRLAFSSHKIVKRLGELGISRDKTHSLEGLTELPKDFIFSFLRGFLDADGCICKSTGRVVFTSNCQKFVSFLIEKLCLVDIKDCYIRKYKMSESYDIWVRTKDSIKLMKNIFSRKLNFNLGFDRKLAIAKKFMVA